MSINTEKHCKDCKRTDVEIKPFRTDYVCRECYEILHFKKFKQYFYQSMKKKEHATVFLINDHTLTFEYTKKMLDLSIEEEKKKRVQVYFIDLVIIDKEDLQDIPFHLYERFIISRSRQMKIDNSQKIIYLDGSNTTIKSSRILTAITKGDVLTVPSIGRFCYVMPDLVVSRPIDFTEEEVLEYMQTTEKLPREMKDSLDKRCEQFIDKLQEEFSHTSNTIIATAQRVIEEDNATRCICCLKPYKPFLNDCQDGKCRTCSALSNSDDLIKMIPL